MVLKIASEVRKNVNWDTALVSAGCLAMSANQKNNPARDPPVKWWRVIFFFV